MRYLRECISAQKGRYNSQKDLLLTEKIIDSFAKHPSQEEITPGVSYIESSLFNARGALVSAKAGFIDTEPA